MHKKKHQDRNMETKKDNESSLPGMSDQHLAPATDSTAAQPTDFARRRKMK